MSDPREEVEKAIKNRELIGDYDTQEARRREQEKAKNKADADLSKAGIQKKTTEPKTEPKRKALTVSDPREEVEKAIKNRELIGDYDTQEARRREQEKAKNKADADLSKAGVQQKKAKPKQETKKPEPKKPEQPIEATQGDFKSTSYETASTKDTSLKELVDKGEKWYQEKIRKPADADLSKAGVQQKKAKPKQETKKPEPKKPEQPIEATQGDFKSTSYETASTKDTSLKELVDKEEKWYQENIRKPADVTAKKRLEGAQEAKAEGKNLEAGIRMSSYAATKVIIGVVEGATFLLRPKAVIKGVSDIGDIITNKQVQVKSDQDKGVYQTVGTRALVVEGIKADPVGFVAELGGNILGGELVASGLSAGYNKLTGTKTVKNVQLQDVEITTKWVTQSSDDLAQSIKGGGPKMLEIELKPSVAKQTSRIPDGFEIEALPTGDTIIGIADQGGASSGFKLSLTPDQIDDLFSGKTVKTWAAKGDIQNIPEGVNPTFIVEEIPSNTPSGRSLNRLTQTDPTDIFKEVGVDTPYTEGGASGWLNVERGDKINLKVVGTVGDDADILTAGGLDDFKIESVTQPGKGKSTPWKFEEPKTSTTPKGTPSGKPSGGPVIAEAKVITKGVNVSPATKIIQGTDSGVGIVSISGGALKVGDISIGNLDIGGKSKTDIGLKINQGSKNKQINWGLQYNIQGDNLGLDNFTGSTEKGGGDTDQETPPIVIPDVIPKQTPKHTPKITPAQITPTIQEPRQTPRPPSFTPRQKGRKGFIPPVGGKRGLNINIPAGALKSDVFNFKTASIGDILGGKKKKKGGVRVI